MGDNGPVSTLVNLAVWLTGVLVSLAVGFGMVDGTLPIRWVSEQVTLIAGWVVVVLTLASVVLAIADRFK
jgi:hypothetical protein